MSIFLGIFETFATGALLMLGASLQIAFALRLTGIIQI
jgi:hypothetical protein